MFINGMYTAQDYNIITPCTLARGYLWLIFLIYNSVVSENLQAQLYPLDDKYLLFCPGYISDVWQVNQISGQFLIWLQQLLMFSKKLSL